MFRLPRLALGTIQGDAQAQPLCWALMDLLVRHRIQTQHFYSRACFSAVNAALPVTGVNSRHLDSWLMSKELCREIFYHGCASSELGLVEGRYNPPHGWPVAESQVVASEADLTSGGRLDALCDWLDLPRLVVLDVTRIRGCLVPERPAQIDALLLDGVRSDAEACRLQTWFEASWGVPVVGALEALPKLREAMGVIPPGGKVPRDLCSTLGDNLSRYARIERILALASRREFPAVRPDVFQRSHTTRPLTVALAYDDAFHCYFPDTLDLLEYLGARLVDFSPLRDEFLPGPADVVYFGCGHPERFATALSSNHCMLSALRNHVRAGGRVYAEGGGLAYLCQHLETPSGRLMPMVGALPAVARLRRPLAPVKAVEVTLAQDNWLGGSGSRLRGYLNSNWLLKPTGPYIHYLAERGHENDLVGRYRVVGSRLHLNLAAQGDLLRSFFEPRTEATAPNSIRAAAR